VRYETAAAFRQALEQRLLSRSRTSSESLVRLRKTVVFDRLLARLSVAAPGRWVLKGALALDFRLGDRGRTTKDIDLVRRDDEESATADLIAAQHVDLGDFFTLSAQKAPTPDDFTAPAAQTLTIPNWPPRTLTRWRRLALWSMPAYPAPTSMSTSCRRQS
jgi:hypothetical protein